MRARICNEADTLHETTRSANDRYRVAQGERFREQDQSDNGLCFFGGGTSHPITVQMNGSTIAKTAISTGTEYNVSDSPEPIQAFATRTTAPTASKTVSMKYSQTATLVIGRGRSTRTPQTA